MKLEIEISAVVDGEHRHLATLELMSKKRKFVVRRSLTQREKEVLKGCMDGLRQKEIGLRLNISTRTVKFHMSTMFQKYGVTSRNELMKEVYGL